MIFLFVFWSLSMVSRGVLQLVLEHSCWRLEWISKKGLCKDPEVLTT